MSQNLSEPRTGTAEKGFAASALLLIATLTVAIVYASVSTTHPVVSGNPPDRPPELVPPDAPDRPPDDEGAALRSTSIGDFTVSGSLEHQTSGTFRNRWKLTLTWEEPSCNGCDIRRYRIHLHGPSERRYYSSWVNTHGTYTAHLQNTIIATQGAGQHHAYVTAYSNVAGGYKNSSNVYFDVQLPDASPTPTHTSTATPTATYTSTPTATPTPSHVATPISTPTAVPTSECQPVLTPTPVPAGERGIDELATKYPKLSDFLLGMMNFFCSTADGSIGTDCHPLYGIYIETSGDVSRILSFLDGKGLRHKFSWGGVYAYDVPFDVAATVSDLPGVLKVHPILYQPEGYDRNDPPVSSTLNEALSSSQSNNEDENSTRYRAAEWHGADEWHTQNYKGQGINVGIIDGGFTDLPPVVATHEATHGPISIQCLVI